MISFFPSDLGCKDTHRHDGVPVGPAWGKADNIPGQQWPLSPIGSPGADFHHGQKLESASPNRPKIRLQSVPFVTTMVAAFKKGNLFITTPAIRSGPPPIALPLNHGAHRCQGFPRFARRLAAALDTACAPWFQLLWAIGSGWAHVIGWFSENRIGNPSESKNLIGGLD